MNTLGLFVGNEEKNTICEKHQQQDLNDHYN